MLHPRDEGSEAFKAYDGDKTDWIAICRKIKWLCPYWDEHERVEEAQWAKGGLDAALTYLKEHNNAL